jgi:type IV secretory pathway VirB10-like protein
MRAGAFTVVVMLLACKDKQAPSPAVPPPTTTTTTTAGTASDAATVGVPPDHPRAPTIEDEPPGEPLSVEDAAKVIPTLEGGKEILPLRQTSDKRQVHATWCLDGDGADNVARKVERQMAAAGYTALAVRGDARKAGVQGERDGFRMSMIVSASSAANCPAPKHYFASATIFRQ